MSYRSKIKHELKGDLSFSGPAAGVAPTLTTGSAKASVDLPDTFILSVVQNLNDKWEMLGDISWTGWSSIPKVEAAYLRDPQRWHCADPRHPLP